MKISENPYLRSAAAAALAFCLAAGARGDSSDLGKTVMVRAEETGGRINASGGHRMDGYNDSYGFIRRVWDPLLKERRVPPLPVADLGSANWKAVSWPDLLPGDILATHQGHRWGYDWHGGLFAGIVSRKAYVYDNSAGIGARTRPASEGGFLYYYLPTHKMLEKSISDRASGSFGVPSASNARGAGMAARVLRSARAGLGLSGNEPRKGTGKTRGHASPARSPAEGTAQTAALRDGKAAPPVRSPANGASQAAAVKDGKAAAAAGEPAKGTSRATGAKDGKAAGVPRVDGIYGMNIDPANPAGFPSADALRAAGVQWVRIEWKTAEGRAFYDPIISNYRSAGINVLLLVDYASVPGAPPSSAADEAWEKYIEAFALGAGALAGHYKDGVDAWQVWNEPDLPPQPGYEVYVRPRLYALMLQKAAGAIRGRSSRPVVTAGLASGNPDYLKSVRAAGGIAADAVAVHPYGQRAPNGWPSPSWGFGNMSAALESYLAFGLPVWITEIGTDDGEIQADYLTNVYRLAAQDFRKRVPHVFWFCWSDEMVSGFGLLGAGGKTKPSYGRYREKGTLMTK